MEQQNQTQTEPFEEREKRIMHSLDMKIILYFILLFATICAIIVFVAWFSFTSGFDKAVEMCFKGTLSQFKPVMC